MEPIREGIEDFIRRFMPENRVLRGLAAVLAAVLAAAVAILLLRGLRKRAGPALIGAILVVGGWLLLGSMTIPRFSTEGPVVRNGTAVVVACGEKRGLSAVDVADEPRTGGWWPVRKGECTVYYHRPPDATQREARHERAAGAQPSEDRPDFAWACGRKVGADRIDITVMRKDCGIFGPQAAGTSGD
jgi:hypothetical protein